MFNSLLRRCVVLLEDINNVDLIKRQEEDEKFVKSVNNVIAKIDVELSKTLKNALKNNKKDTKTRKSAYLIFSTLSMMWLRTKKEF